MKTAQTLDHAARRELWGHMRVPTFAFAALLALLAVIVLLGLFVLSHTASWIEVGLTVCMAVTVLLFSMEVTHDAPITRVFAGLGILFGMTLLDYLSRQSGIGKRTCSFEREDAISHSHLPPA